MLELSNFILSGMKLTAQNHHCFQNAICTSFCCEAAVSNLIFSLLKNWELFMVFLWQAGGKKERDRCIMLNLNSVKFQRLTKFWWHIQKSLWLSWLFILEPPPGKWSRNNTSPFPSPLLCTSKTDGFPWCQNKGWCKLHGSPYSHDKVSPPSFWLLSIFYQFFSYVWSWLQAAPAVLQYRKWQLGSKSLMSYTA